MAPNSKSPTLGDVVRSAARQLPLQPWCTPRKEKVFRYIASCGTGHLGWRVTHCRDCGKDSLSGLGCQSSYCPRCGNGKRKEWTEKREAEVIDAPYFHYVFTVPGDFYGTFLRYQADMYKLLFDAVNQTLKAFTADPRFLGGTPPIFAVLHTTNQRLGYHPHVHVVIGGAGVNDSGELVRAKNPKFLFPARALAAKFRGKFRAELRARRNSGAIQIDPLHRVELDAAVRATYNINWQVHTKHADRGPKATIRYLARYTYRTAISDSRIVRLNDGLVSFRYKDRKRKRTAVDTIPVMEFLERFQRHILPSRFQRVRYWGSLAGTNRKTKHNRLKLELKAEKDAADRAKDPEERQNHCSCCKSTDISSTTSRAQLPDFIPNTMAIPPPGFLGQIRQVSP